MGVISLEAAVVSDVVYGSTEAATVFAALAVVFIISPTILTMNTDH